MSIVLSENSRVNAFAHTHVALSSAQVEPRLSVELKPQLLFSHDSFCAHKTSITHSNHTWRWLIVYSFERESWKIFSVSGKARIYVVGLENYLSNLTSCDCRSQNNSLGTYRFANLAIMEIESTSGLTSDEVHSTPGCWLRRRGKTCIADTDLWILSCKQTEIEKGSEIMSCSRKFPCFLVQCLRRREISFNRRLRSLVWRLNYRLLQPSRSSRSQTTK